MLRHFLLADDDQDDTDLFTEALGKIDASLELVSAENGKALLKTLRELPISPDIIFLDVNMPEMDGWECLRALKEDDQFRDIPVIMYSTSSVSINGKKAIQNGALCFLEKPSSFLKLKDFLEQLTKVPRSNLIDTLRAIRSQKTHKLFIADAA